MKKTFIAMVILGFLFSACGDDDSPRCGDGVIDTELGEQCDGRNVGGYTCQDVDPNTLGGVLRCHNPGHENECKFDLSTCERPTCGNNIAEAGEQCDGYDLKGESCIGMGHDAGTLKCYGPDDENPCTYDESGCLNSPYCGDGYVDVSEGEECDGTSLNGETCQSLGFLGGNLFCTSDCEFDTGDCQEPVCGNDLREADEVCDGGDLNGENCITMGYLEGELECAEDCLSFDESGCSGHPVCGDGVIEGNEVCDGGALGGESCVTRGYLEGSLACAEDCKSFDESGCSGTSNCVVDYPLGALPDGVPVNVDGDLSGATDDNSTSCNTFGIIGSVDQVVQFTLPMGGDVTVQYEFGMMAMSVIALFNAANENCDDEELACEDASMDGQIFYEGLSSGSYFLIVEDASFMGGGGPYSLVLTATVSEDPEICDNSIDDNGNGLIDCEDSAHCCGEAHCSSDPDYCNLDASTCTSDASCQGGICFREEDTGWPAGFCTSDCGNTGTCGSSGLECVQYTPSGGSPMDVCIATCSGESSDCREGYLCSDFGNGLIACYPDCVDNSECPDTGECNLESGMCEPNKGLNPTGGECTGYDACEGGVCFKEADFGVNAGYCSSTCSLSDPHCPNDGVCVNYFDTPADDGYCFVACNDVGDCRDDTNFQCVENSHNPPPADLICDWN